VWKQTGFPKGARVMSAEILTAFWKSMIASKMYLEQVRQGRKEDDGDSVLGNSTISSSTVYLAAWCLIPSLFNADWPFY
jgi:hypothetical protein